MQNHIQSQISTTARGLLTTTSKCSFQTLPANTLSTEPWANWVTWDLLLKSSDSAPIEKSVHDLLKNRPPLMPSFYKQRQPTPSPFTTSHEHAASPALGTISSSSQYRTQNPALDPLPLSLSQLAFPQSSLAKALMMGPITLTYRGKLASHAATARETTPVSPTASHVEFEKTTSTLAAIKYAYGVEMNTPQPFARTRTSHVWRMIVSSSSHTQTTG
jgi:hypothetical protein